MASVSIVFPEAEVAPHAHLPEGGSGAWSRAWIHSQVSFPRLASCEEARCSTPRVTSEDGWCPRQESNLRHNGLGRCGEPRGEKRLLTPRCLLCERRQQERPAETLRPIGPTTARTGTTPARSKVMLPPGEAVLIELLWSLARALHRIVIASLRRGPPTAMVLAPGRDDTDVPAGRAPPDRWPDRVRRDAAPSQEPRDHRV